jgi:hypothetical protein
MKRNLALVFALIGWFAIIGQFVLSIENRIAPVAEAVIRFFSYFTIQVNILVAVYFTCLLLPAGKRPKIIDKPGTLTAITTYITIVGLTYQVALRHVWKPEGMQFVVNELLHSVIPVLVIIFWWLYKNMTQVRYVQILKWAIYPLAYLGYSLIRGSIVDFYPYYFIDVIQLGMTQTLINAGIVTILFFVIAALFVFIGKSFSKR